MLTEIGHLLDILEVAGVGTAQDNHHTDRVLVDEADGFFRVHDEVCLFVDGD